MTQHTFSPELFGRLQKHAKPFVDTVESVIARALDALEAGSPSTTHQENGSKGYSSVSPPDLTHTTLRFFEVEGVEPAKDVHWSALLAAAIAAAKGKGAEASAICEALTTPRRSGKFEGAGYRYVESADVSFQQLNSIRSWEQVRRLAEAFELKIKIRWIWSNHPKAYAPNGTGVMQIG